MSVKRFPLRLKANDPPLVRGELKDGRPTPTYVLAWTCPPEVFYTNLARKFHVKEGVDNCNFYGVVRKNWIPDPVDGLKNEPLPILAEDGNFYLVALFNRHGADHKRRVAGNISEDGVISSARAAMCVDLDEDVDGTLQWLRWPLDWLDAEERRRLMAEYRRLKAAGELIEDSD